MSTATARIKLDGSQFEAAGKSIVGTFKNMAGGMLQVAGGIALYNTAIKAATGATNLFKSAIGQAAEMEDMVVGFEVLLGSAEAAENRMRELADFAASTPFQLPEIAEASKQLQTLTQGALATGEGLTLVGDVAAMAGRPFTELSMWVGRLYDGLQSGRPVGEAMARLQEMGVISGKTRGEIEALQKTGAEGDEVWKAARGALEQFSGTMEKRSGTWNGLLSTLKDNIGEAFRSFGKPLIDSFKPALERAIERAKALVPVAKRFGQNLANGVIRITELIKSGQIGELLKNSISLAFKESINILIGGIKTAIDILGAGIKAVFSAEFGGAIVETFIGIGFKIQGILVEAFAGPIAFLQAGIIKAFNEVSNFWDEYQRGILVEKFRKEKEKALEKGPFTEEGRPHRERADELQAEIRKLTQGMKTRSFEEIKEEILSEGVKFGIFEPMTADQLNEKGGEHLDNAKTLMKKPIETFLEGMGGVKFNKSDFIDTSKERGAIKELFEGAFRQREELTKEEEQSKNIANKFGTLAAKTDGFQASSLARVGGGGGVDQAALEMARLAKRQLDVQQDMLTELKKANMKKGGLN